MHDGKNSYRLVVLMGAIAGAHSVYGMDAAHQGTFVLDRSRNVIFEQFSQQSFALQLLQAKGTYDPHAVVLGGMAQADLQAWDGDRLVTVTREAYEHGSGLYLTAASFDVMADVSQWGMVFASLSGTQLGQGGADGNYIYFPHAFLLFGNLKYFPLYSLAGINLIPFGTFVGSGTWDTPLTYNYFNPQQAPQLALSFYKSNWNLNALYYRDEVNYQNHFVSSFFYNTTQGAYSYGFGAGFLTNLKSNATGNINSFNRRKRDVAASDMGNALDVNATAGYKIVSVSAEYLTGTNPVAGNSADPAAYSVSVSLTPEIAGRTTTFGVARSVSLHLKNVPTTLPGRDAVPMVSSGLKGEWAASVSRPVMSQYVVLGLSAIKAVTYDDRDTYAYTLDLTAFL